jgi:hypothetical protein
MVHSCLPSQRSLLPKLLKSINRLSRQQTSSHLEDICVMPRLLLQSTLSRDSSRSAASAHSSSMAVSKSAVLA